MTQEQEVKVRAVMEKIDRERDEMEQERMTGTPPLCSMYSPYGDTNPNLILGIILFMVDRINYNAISKVGLRGEFQRTSLLTMIITINKEDNVLNRLKRAKCQLSFYS